MHLFNCALLNAFIIFKTLNRDKNSKFSKFLLTHANQYGYQIINPTLTKMSKLMNIVLLLQEHTGLIQNDGCLVLSNNMNWEKKFSDKANKFVKKKIRVCSAHKIRKLSAYICKTCKNTIIYYRILTKITYK